MIDSKQDEAVKLEACPHSTLTFHSGGYYVGCVDCHANWVAIKPPNDSTLDHARRSTLVGIGTFQFVNAARTTPANLNAPDKQEGEADVERAFRAGHAAGFDCADNTSRAEVNHVEDAWGEYRSTMTTRPAGGEEVDRG